MTFSGNDGPVDVATLSPQTGRAHLQAVDALLDAAGARPDFAALFAAFRIVFGFDRALLLAAHDDSLHCVAALPDAQSGLACALTPLLHDVLCGRVVTIGGDAEVVNIQGSILPDAPLGAGQPALLFPILAGDQPAIMLLRRNPGADDFGDIDTVWARHYAILALALTGMRAGDMVRDEVVRLRAELARRSDQSESFPSRELLREIVERLPIGLTVQDESGRFLVVNPVAATNLAMPPETLIGSSPADFLPNEEARQRRQWELGLIDSGGQFITEECHADDTGERTWLTSHTALQVGERAFLMSTSNDITDRKRIENELARRAYFDDLTGLPNRILIERRVDELLAADGDARFALAFIDLDNFKHINDYYSHAIGDALLVKVTQRICKCLRATDMLARISGDEFLLVAAPLDDETEIQNLIHAVLAELKKPFHIESFELFTSASLGVSVYPEHGASYEALRRNADNAMYRAKNGTKGGAIYFNVAMGQTVTARMELEQRLRLAIRDHKFCCAFQPKVDLHGQEVVGFETLVRWRDEDGEIQPPSNFVNLAIELGLIDPITRFVFDDAVRSVERLDAAFGADTTISVNVASKQAGDIEFMRSFIEAIKASGIAQRLMIELTEDAFVGQGQFQRQVLPLLREIGVRISIDDFGTGYSSLSALADITADELKVDRSFITDIHQRPRSQGVLRAIESLGNSLGMTIVAEGIETFEELTYLRTATRIRQAQGFYFSKPFLLTEMDLAHQFVATGRAHDASRLQGERRTTLSARGNGA